MHPHFYLLFKTVISGWKGEDGLGENTTFMAYNSNKEVHLTGSGGAQQYYTKLYSNNFPLYFVWQQQITPNIDL